MIKMWSRHSRRTLPTKRSQIAFARGALIGVRSTSIPLPTATAAKCEPYFASLSRIRYFGASPNGVASRSCWATHASEGECVTPTWIMRRDPSSVMKNAKIGVKHTSVTWRKSQAQISLAWLCRKVAQDCPEERGGRVPQIFLDRALGYVDSYLQQLTADPLGTP